MRSANIFLFCLILQSLKNWKVNFDAKSNHWLCKSKQDSTISFSCWVGSYGLPETFNRETEICGQINPAFVIRGSGDDYMYWIKDYLINYLFLTFQKNKLSVRVFNDGIGEYTPSNTPKTLKKYMLQRFANLPESHKKLKQWWVNNELVHYRKRYPNPLSQFPLGAISNKLAQTKLKINYK